MDPTEAAEQLEVVDQAGVTDRAEAADQAKAAARAQAVPAVGEHLTPADHWVGNTNRQRNKLDRSITQPKKPPHPASRRVGCVRGDDSGYATFVVLNALSCHVADGGGATA